MKNNIKSYRFPSTGYVFIERKPGAPCPRVTSLRLLPPPPASLHPYPAVASPSSLASRVSSQSVARRQRVRFSDPRSTRTRWWLFRRLLVCRRLARVCVQCLWRVRAYMRVCLPRCHSVYVRLSDTIIVASAFSRLAHTETRCDIEA